MRSGACVALTVVAALATTMPGWADNHEPTGAEAEEFVRAAEEKLLGLWIDAERAAWVQSNFITDDTEILAAKAYEKVIAANVELAKEANRFSDLDLSAELERKLMLLRTALVMPAPSDGPMRQELTQIAASMESTYGRGRYCPEGGQCRDLGDLSRTMGSSRDPEELLEAWQGWRTVSPAMRESYQRFAELGNQGARELGFADLGAMWRSSYDMAPDDFSAELDRLWGQVEPLYDSLHCFVRARLNDHYGDEIVPPNGPIPAHLLGNMWAQTWANIFPLVAPADADPGFDLTERLKAKGLDAREMVRYGEQFFSSLGFEPLPESFWERSLFTQPEDHDVVCHASAWNVDQIEDLRIKMCIEVNAEDFSTIHHELGHNYYQRAYNSQSPLFRGSANDGFHEGIGDTLALSVTPGYLVDLGLLDKAPDEANDIGVLLTMALDKVAFLPFGLLVDQWRWQVFSGEIAPDEYNAAWWDLRNRYQGVGPPVERTEEQFDAGAKYHVPANTPYTRYFLAHILQFQFHRALCEIAGFEGPLHRCSIYGSEEAGARLNEMLEMGLSRPWPDALEKITGQRQMDATAILDYFAPLQSWLDAENEGRTCGWAAPGS